MYVRMARTAQRRKPAVPRAPLTRQRVLRAATKVADKEGLESLSMRRLGQELAVEAMSLYNHVRNKDDVLDGMVDAIFTEIELPAEGAGWRTAMRRRAEAAHDVLLRHAWAIGLLESRLNAGTATLRHHEAVLRCLRDSGFSVEMAGHANAVLDAYVYGFTMTELALPLRDSGGVPEAAATIMKGFGPGEYPHLVEFAVERAMKPGYSFGNEFQFGLDLILDGLERLATPAFAAPA
jgi:AcrR family transcriptional regulator